jgi:hypothetical protein
MNYIPNISSYATKVAGVLAYMVQYGCITHCALEYVGDFVIVSRLSVSAFGVFKYGETAYSLKVIITVPWALLNINLA